MSSNRLFYFQGLSFLYYCTYNDTILFRWDSSVVRYRNSVQTLRLSEIEISDADVLTIDLNMTKTSTWMAGHDKSKALHSDRPVPTDVLNDINMLKVFAKEIVARRKTTKKRRSAMLLPSAQHVMPTGN